MNIKLLNNLKNAIRKSRDLREKVQGNQKVRWRSFWRNIQSREEKNLRTSSSKSGKFLL